MVSKFEDILERCNAKVKEQAQRVKNQDALRKVFLLDTPVPKGKPDWVQVVIDPQPFNAIIWTTQLLSTSDPSLTIQVPADAMPEAQEIGAPEALAIQAGNGRGKQGGLRGLLAGLPSFLTPHIQPDLQFPPMPGQEEPKAPHEDMGDKLEALMQTALHASDVRQDATLVRELVLSGFLYGQECTKVADLRMTALANKQVELPKFMSYRPPFSYKACEPQSIFSERDLYGLSFVLHRYVRPYREVKAAYPSVKYPAEFKSDENGNVVWCEAWTRDEYCCWIQQSAEEVTIDQTREVDKLVIVQDVKANVLGFIPFVIRTAQGSKLFAAPEDQLFPLLYPGWKGKLYERANLFLTVISSLAFGMANTQWVHETNDTSNPIKFEFDRPNIMQIRQGEKVYPLPMPISAELNAALQLIMQKEDEASVPKVIAGQVPGGWGNTAAAAINQMIQGGKLSLVPVQVSVAESYAQMVDMTLDYMRAYQALGVNQPLEFYARGSRYQVSADQLPTYIDTLVRLEPKLPQDQALLYDIAIKAWKELFIDHETAWDLAGVEDKNKVREGLEKEKQALLAEQQQAQQAQAGQMQGQGEPTNPAMIAGSGLPGQMGNLDLNPQPDGMGLEQMQSAMENMNAGIGPQGG